ncbi:lysophospholipid acyltransferase 2-like [Oscarella lobularis]|uniref:lysophospholipid acyltransferase 2-like n=1 Tax=Oscarella lobularis TaxID=121494 RepID=UPI0033139ADE
MNVFYYPDLVVVRVATLIKAQPQQVSLLLCFGLSFLAGLAFRCLLLSASGRTLPGAARTRHALSMGLGLALGFFCYRWDFFINVVSALIAYILIRFVVPQKVHYVVFGSAMGILSIVHAQRVVTHALDNGQYKMDVSGSLMVLTQRLTALACSIHDGMGRKRDDLTRDQEEQCVREIPSVLEFFSYAFNFPTILIGPLCFYRDYICFIEGKHYLVEDKNGHVRRTSGVKPALKKFLFSLMWLGLYVKFVGTYSIQLNGDPDVLNRPWLQRSWIAYASMLTQRFRFYFAWTIADSIANAAGLGFNGFDENSNEKWNLITNTDILGTEFALNFKHLLESWNIQTSVWLKRVCYERVKFRPFLLTNILVAWWHGFFPIYYVGWVGFGFSVLAARHIRRVIRPYFQKHYVLQRFYDCLTIVTTMAFLTYYVVTIALMDFGKTFSFWRSQYFLGHLIPIAVVLLCSRKKQVKKDKDD